MTKETPGAKLIFSVTGDNSKHDPNVCWAYTGKAGSQGGANGQTINLVHTYCRKKGVVIHEVLHSLGISTFEL